MMINFYKKFKDLNKNIKNIQYLINIKGVIKAYFGISQEGYYSLSFLSKDYVEIKGTTKNIKIVQGKESDNWWTCFYLLSDTLLAVFSSFAEDLISCVYDEMDEARGLSNLKKRFNTWLALFKKSRTPLSLEKAKGLYGELYFLNSYMIEKYGVDKSINSWSGCENYNKDFSVDETWYEIKTIGLSTMVVKISSIHQLSSDKDGKLIVIRTEEMSDAYDADKSSINKLCQEIISKIEDSTIKDIFLDKISEVGYDFQDDLGNKNYRVDEIEKYLVNEKFPALRLKDINSDAINNVSYDLILKFIEDFKEN